MKILSTTLISLALTAAASQGALILVGGTTLNGNFNADTSATDSRSYSDTPNWTNLGGVDSIEATRGNVALANDTTRNLVVNLDGTRISGNDTGYVIATGDVFDISYVWRDAFGWGDDLDQVAVTLFTTDNNILTGLQEILVTNLSGLSTVDSTYETVDNNGIYTALAADAGRTLFVRINGQVGVVADIDIIGFARLDDFVLEVIVVPEPSVSLMALFGAGLLLRRRRR